MPAMPAINKANGLIDWALREKELRELCDPVPPRTTAAMTVWCPAPAARTASTPRTC